MEKKSNDKGITLVALVITIVLLLIISSFAIIAGKSTIESAKMNVFSIEIQTLQSKVNELAQELGQKQKEKDNEGVAQIKSIGNALQGTEEETTAFTKAGINDTSGYKYFSKEVLTELGLVNFKNEYLVNVEKRNVIGLNGVEYEGKTYYTADQLSDNVYNVEHQSVESCPTFDIEAVEKGILIKNIRYIGDVKKGTIYYGQGTDQNSVDWRVAKTDSTDTTVSINVENVGKWYAKIIDSANNQSAVKECTVKINAIEPVMESVTFAYDGQAHTVKIVSQGKGGTAKYRASTDGGINYGNWQTTLPSITNWSDAKDGTLYVQAQMEGNDTWIESEIETATVTITKAQVNINVNNPEIQYTGSTIDVSQYVQNMPISPVYTIKTNGTTTPSTLTGSMLTLGAMNPNNDENQTVVVTVGTGNNANYVQESKDITITVQKYTRTLTYTNTTPSSMLSSETDKYATVDVAGTGGTAGSLTYQVISGGDCLEINSTTGKLTPKSKAGEAQVKARMARTTTVTEAEAIKTIAIDKDDVKPVISIEVEKITSRSIKIKATATDEKSGIIDSYGFKYYIATDENSLTTLHGTETTGIYEFDQLNANTTYFIKVTREDASRNEGAKIIDVTTNAIPEAETAINRTITWHADSSVSITLSTEQDYTIKYSLDNSTWSTYTNTITSHNQNSVYICLSDGVNSGRSYEIKLLDLEGPQITLTRENTTTNSITISASAEDSASGMPETIKYNYYIKKSNEADYQLIAENVANTQITFDNLTANTTYNIKVTSKDLIGNTGTATIDVGTPDFTLQGDNIEFKNETWQGGKASIDIINNTSSKMQYQVVTQSQPFNNSNWQTVEEKIKTLSNLQNGSVIFVRLNDGNNATEYATYNINDIREPLISNVTKSTENWTKDSVAITVNATDSESGLANQAYSFDGGTTWQSSNTKTYTENTTGIVIKVKDKAENITEYSQTLSISNIDKTGPELQAETEVTSTTITVNITDVTDSGSGLNESIGYKYYIATSRSGVDSATPETVYARTKTFVGVTTNVTYYIKIEAEDNIQNKGTIYITAVPGALNVDSNSLTISNPTWQNKSAKVTITNNATQYDLEYQIVGAEDTFDPQGTWTKPGQNTIEITTLKSGDTVYARLTDIDDNKSGTIQKAVVDNTPPTVNVTGNATNWTNSNVTLTVTASDTESGLQNNAYSFDGGNTWQASNTKQYTENTSGIVVKVRDEANNIAEYGEVINITKIDKTGPNVDITINSKTTKSISITASATDTASGITNGTQYKYYIKETTAGNYTKIAETTSNTYTYQQLKFGTGYDIKVEINDALQNAGYTTISTTTDNLAYVAGNIEATSIVWSNGLATVGVRNNRDDFPVKYQVQPQGTEPNLNGEWTTVYDKTFQINNIPRESVIYLKLTDEYNVSQSHATININDGMQGTYSESALTSSTTRGNFQIYGISSAENEIRVQIEGEQPNGSLYTYYYKNINDNDYTIISTNTYYYDQAVIRDVVPNGIYKIKAVVKDTSGNLKRSENTATIIASTNAEQNQTYVYNKTYIDKSHTIVTSKTAGTGTITPGNTENVQAGHAITLPGTFQITNSASVYQGITVKDSSQNEFVWIPVNDTFYDGVTQMPTNSATASITYKPLALRQTANNSYYESLIWYYNGTNSWRDTSNTGIGKSAYKEPSLVTGTASDGYTWNVSTPVGVIFDADVANYGTAAGFNSTEEMGVYMANSYNAMTTAVDVYGGFYIGRYETTGTNNNITVKPNSTVYTGSNWYTMYKQLDSTRHANNPYYNTVSVTSSMMWGAQWDATLNFLLEGEGENYISTKKLGTSKMELSPSGTDEDDMISNIYDLGSNAYEWTLQANRYDYRVARGGGYNVVFADKMSTKKNYNPTESGPALGTRMTLYVQSTSDVTKPTLSMGTKSATTNSITVTCSSVDRETGIKKYEYYVSEDGVNWGTPYNAISNKYTFTGLKQNTKYHIKIQTTDGAGNQSDEITTTQSTSVLGAVAVDNISVIQRLGTNDNGTIVMQATSTYTGAGYYIEYQVATSVQAINPNNWIKSDNANGVQTGQTIYATLFDGVNRSTDYFVFEVEDLEQFKYIDSFGNSYTDEQAQLTANAGKTTYDTTILYEDSDGATATIPAGFKVGVTDLVNNINNGLVIQDTSGNQFVWVPVPNAICTNASSIPTNTTNATKDTVNYRPMAIAQTGDNTRFYESIIYNFFNSGGRPWSYRNTSSTGIGKSGSREPSLITGAADYTWNVTLDNKIGTAYDTDIQYYQRLGFTTGTGLNIFKDYTDIGHYMNQEYTNMIQSVDKYKGFYVARFETSTANNLTTGNNNSDVNTVVRSVRDVNPICNQNWYKFYYYHDSNLNPRNPYYNVNSVTCSTIWGCQWDAIMNWMLLDANTRYFVTAKVGNHENRIAKTGEFTDDLAKNIFDLSSNMHESTQEAYSNYCRPRRGSGAITSADKYYYNTSQRMLNWGSAYGANYTYTNLNDGKGDIVTYYAGSRMALYINNQENLSNAELEKPTIQNVSTTPKTNNIKITVKAIDLYYGIDKYNYYLYDKNNNEIARNEGLYKFENIFYGLSQGTKYYVKVDVINKKGKIKTSEKIEVTTESISLQSGDIVLTKVWGKNGDGRAYFKLADTYVNDGYYLQYIVLKDGVTYQESMWNDTAKVFDKNKIRGVNNTNPNKELLTGLEVNDNIYVRLYDGNNSATSGSNIVTAKVTTLEEYKWIDEDGTTLYDDTQVVGNETHSSKTKNVEYEDGNGEKATIPAGFKVGTSSLVNTISNGLVIEDSDENQFVWVPVKDAIYDSKLGKSISSNNNYTPMAELQSADSQYYASIPYTINTSNYNATRYDVNYYGFGKANFREPSLVTGTANYTWSYDSGTQYDGQASIYNKILNAIGITTPTQLGMYMNNEYTEMVKGVDKYGGFYIGRYETTTKTDANKIANNNNYTNVARTKLGYRPQSGTSGVNWYRMYLLQDSNYSNNPYYNNQNIKTSMIWGAQWDQACIFALNGNDKNTIITRTGNHTGTLAPAGWFGNDIANNIFDLSSNLQDWTQEAHGTFYREERGGVYSTNSNGVAVSRGSPTPTNTSSSYGSRMAMYIKVNE